MNKSLGMLGLALLCGLGAMYGTLKLIAKDKAPVVEKQDVLVAVRDLKVEEVIKPELVKVVQMDKSAVPMGSFSSVKDVEDRWVQVATLEGEALVDRKLAAKGSPPGLISRIPKGMRAYAIDVNEQSGVSGFVLPDHRVDVVQIEQGPPGQTQAEAVLQDVLVLASGQTFTRPDDRSIQARTVTLAVTPEQVETLVAAKQRGSLTLSLRGVNDHEQTVLRKKAPKEKEKETPAPIKELALAAPVEPPPPPPAPPATPKPARHVAIYRGGPGNVQHVRLDDPNDPAADPFAGTMTPGDKPDRIDPIFPKGSELK
jgi:pilus assembly protein CpaB